MKITVSQLRKIIREEVQKNLTESNFKVGDKVTEKGTDSGWWEILELIPDNRTGKTAAKLKMFSPAGGRTTTTYVNTDKLTKVRESVSHSSSSPLKDGGVVNRDSGEWLEIDSLPSQYLDHVEIEMGYTTLPNEQFEELRGELKGLSAGKPKKQRKAPFQLNKESPNPQDVHDEFLKLRDYDGEVPLKMLAAGLGVEPNQIDWNETGLRVINGVVTELLGDPPYREKMGEVKNLTESNPEPVLKLGNIYRNKAGHQISIEFLEGGFAGWELVARGKSKSLDGTSKELQAALTAGGFRFDRNENVY